MLKEVESRVCVEMGLRGFGLNELLDVAAIVLQAPPEEFPRATP